MLQLKVCIQLRLIYEMFIWTVHLAYQVENCYWFYNLNFNTMAQVEGESAETTYVIYVSLSWLLS